MRTINEYISVAQYAASKGITRQAGYQHVRAGKVSVVNLAGRIAVVVNPDRDQQAA
jgi:hypothetical protein